MHYIYARNYPDSIGPDCPPAVFIEPLLGVIREQDNDLLDTREQGTTAKLVKGGGILKITRETGLGPSLVH